jgi:hypothetical protein
MGKPSAAQLRAEGDVKRVNEVLRSRLIPPTVWSWSFTERNVECWVAGTQPAIALPATGTLPLPRALAGDWYLTAKWTYRNVPAARGEAELIESSIGLNVDHGFVPQSGRQCLIRYDTDPLGFGTHLQVLQFSPLDDHIHWQLPGLAVEAWSFEAVLEFLLSQPLVDDLQSRNWPLR